jgi:IS5 family transposase
MYMQHDLHMCFDRLRIRDQSLCSMAGAQTASSYFRLSHRNFYKYTHHTTTTNALQVTQHTRTNVDVACSASQLFMWAHQLT